MTGHYQTLYGSRLNSVYNELDINGFVSSVQVRLSSTYPLMTVLYGMLGAQFHLHAFSGCIFFELIDSNPVLWKPHLCLKNLSE
jgi:hypothetical protein